MDIGNSPQFKEFLKFLFMLEITTDNIPYYYRACIDLYEDSSCVWAPKGKTQGTYKLPIFEEREDFSSSQEGIKFLVSTGKLIFPFSSENLEIYLGHFNLGSEDIGAESSEIFPWLNLDYEDFPGLTSKTYFYFLFFFAIMDRDNNGKYFQDYPCRAHGAYCTPIEPKFDKTEKWNFLFFLQKIKMKYRKLFLDMLFKKMFVEIRNEYKYKTICLDFNLKRLKKHFTLGKELSSILKEILTFNYGFISGYEKYGKYFAPYLRKKDVFNGEDIEKMYTGEFFSKKRKIFSLMTEANSELCDTPENLLSMRPLYIGSVDEFDGEDSQHRREWSHDLKLLKKKNIKRFFERKNSVRGTEKHFLLLRKILTDFFS